MDVNFYTTKRGDRLPILSITARDSLGPVDLSGYSAVLRAVNVFTGATKINAAATIATDPTFTVDANTDTLTLAGGTVIENQDVTLKTSGALPGGLSASKKYFCVNVSANGATCKLSESKGGTAVNITSAGSGTHTLIAARVTYEWTALDTDTAGTYHAQIEATKDGKRLTFPNDSNITIEILSDLSDNSERSIAIIAALARVQHQAAPKITQGVVELEIDRARMAQVWAANTFYAAGVEIVPPVRNGYAYRSILPGVSRSAVTLTDWPTDYGETFRDGQDDSMLEWENVGSAVFNGGISGAETIPYDIRRAARQCWLIKARLASQMVDDGDLSYGQLHTNCLAHANSFQPFRRHTRIV